MSLRALPRHLGGEYGVCRRCGEALRSDRWAERGVRTTRATRVRALLGVTSADVVALNEPGGLSLGTGCRGLPF